MRRNVGVAAIKNKQLAAEKYRTKSNQMAETNFAQIMKQFESFKSYLEEFAVKHKEKIRKSPEFRAQFQTMCASIGVDPLASSKGFWAEVLGVGDFYYHLATRIVEVTLSTAGKNGGLMDVDELVHRLNATRSKMETEAIIREDVMRAIKTLNVLGNGFSIVTLGQGRQMVQSVPGELSMDQTNVLRLAQQNGGRVTVDMLTGSELAWTVERAEKAVEYLIKEGIAWVDDCGSTPTQYWVPGLFQVGK